MFRSMLRSKQALAEEECVALLEQERRGVLSVLGDDDYPYGMPMNFWYCREDGHLYFHSGKRGHKIDGLTRHNKVSFCVYDQGVGNEGEWALTVKSVIVFGRIRPVDDFDRAMEICHRLSERFTDDQTYIQSEINTFGKATLCLELIPEHITGKRVKES